MYKLLRISGRYKWNMEQKPKRKRKGEKRKEKIYEATGKIIGKEEKSQWKSWFDTTGARI